MTDRTSAEMLEQHIRGLRLASSDGPAWRDALVQIFVRERVEDSFIVPAVAEPLIVWILSGTAVVEERSIGGSWLANRVEVGDFFLTTTDSPYEMRWHVEGPERFEVMHLYVALSVLDRAVKDVHGASRAAIRLREVSGEHDAILSLLLEQFRLELTSRHDASQLFVQGLAQSLAVHIVRAYTDPNAQNLSRRNALPAFKLHRVTDLMEANLSEEFSLTRLAAEAGMSDYHFSRLFKKATSLSPSQYFIRLRMARARRLLLESTRSVIEIGMDVGYSSPSHFAQIFRREVGVSPTDYRR